MDFLIEFQLYPDGYIPGAEDEGGVATPDWIPVELEMVTKLWLPDSEILRLKGFHSLSVLDRLQVSRRRQCTVGVTCSLKSGFDSV